MTNEEMLMQAVNDRVLKLLTLKREILLKLVSGEATKVDKKNLEKIMYELALFDTERLILFLTENKQTNNQNNNDIN